MIVHDKTYRLQPEAGHGARPTASRQCAWRVRIIDLDLGEPGVRHLRPIIVVAEQIGPRISLTSCADSIGNKIRRDFVLEINRVLWIEQRASRPGQWLVARFKPRPSGAHLYYEISWRPIRANENRLLNTYLPEPAEAARN